MREKLVLAATLTFSLYLFVGVSASVKTPKNYVMRSPEGSASPANTMLRYSVIPLPRSSSAFHPAFE
ncbi:hypothetical protein [Kamptonema sp. UHCC 0994]|uniref:hypothetical protein n=1 Tax=Kamptonema sp. UHCC 0994 TaxID=3031329 RepID=UPI0023B9F180|nr:hypothetical protein [Kamptonema sp. UHCC 0994]MDF0555438.1 hypothetical protein [Kamptonema sp. UHCC 0994]